MPVIDGCVITIPAKLCNQRQLFSHDVELNNKGNLHLPLHYNVVSISVQNFHSTETALLKIYKHVIINMAECKVAEHSHPT